MAAVGFKIIFNAQVHEARDMPEAATLLLAAREFGMPARARARVTLTSDRDLTYEEQAEMVQLAATLHTKAVA